MDGQRKPLALQHKILGIVAIEGATDDTDTPNTRVALQGCTTNTQKEVGLTGIKSVYNHISCGDPSCRTSGNYDGRHDKQGSSCIILWLLWLVNSYSQKLTNDPTTIIL
jgi:hypothetical protein